MVNCPNCDKLLELDAKYCIHCGAYIEKFKKYSLDLEKTYQNSNLKRQSKENELFINPIDNNPFYRPFQPDVHQQKSSSKYQPKPVDPTKLTSHPIGLIFIVLYELFVSFLLISFGNNEYNYASTFIFQSNIIQYYRDIGLIFLLWGVLGLFAGFLLLLKLKIGYHLSRIFLFSTGIVFFWVLLIPFFIMSLSFIYFNANDNFKYIFKRSSLILEPISHSNK